MATPLGNLRDITLRALDILRGVAVVAAEDTRVSRHLLAHYEARARLIPLHEHNESSAASSVLQSLQAGEAVAYVTDAGTPCISDPGAILVAKVRAAGFPVVAVPGASAITAALSAAGLQIPHFLFYGFLPAKRSGRLDVLKALSALPYALVVFEAPHRVADTLADIVEVFGEDGELAIARELTKRFEEWYRGSIGGAPAWLAEIPERAKGEFVLLIGARPVRSDEGEDVGRTLELLLEELPLSRAVSLAARITGAKKNMLYEQALELKNKMD